MKPTLATNPPPPPVKAPPPPPKKPEPRREPIAPPRKKMTAKHVTVHAGLMTQGALLAAVWSGRVWRWTKAAAVAAAGWGRDEAINAAAPLSIAIPAGVVVFATWGWLK